HQNAEVIQIPKRIERGPTDILKALAEVTGKDFSGPDYRYIDDPFLTPLSNHQKRLFSLSRESGRRAANYVFEEFPELFYRDVSEPKVEAFTYKEVYDESTEVDETDLKKCIARKEVKHSITCYKNMTTAEKTISAETLQKLLELVSFYNCEEPPDLEFIVEKAFNNDTTTPRVLWKDNGFAEQLFESMDEKTSEIYCALIQGLAKHSAPQKAYQCYQEMIEKGFKLNTETFNSILRVTPLLRESTETRWLFIEEVLNSMKANAIKPNLQTLNSILEVVTRFGSTRYAQNLAKKTLVEMITILGIEPSLATYYHLLNIFDRDKSPNRHILYDIMDRIENKKFIIQDTKDVNFFTRAMNVCQYKLMDISLAYRVHDLVSNGNNAKLLGNILSESNYHQMLFRLLSTSEDIKVFMQYYEKYVPNVYIPEPLVFGDIFRMIELFDAFDYLPTIWEDLKRFEYISQIKLMEDYFYLISKPVADTQIQERHKHMVIEGLQIIKDRVENQEKHDHVVINYPTGVLLGFAIDICLNANDVDNAIIIMQNMIKDGQKITGNASPNTLSRLCINAIDSKKYSSAKQCIEFCVELAMSEAVSDIRQHVQQSDLDPKIKALLEETCGPEVIIEVDIEDAFRDAFKEPEPMDENNKQ
ncbi:unnamed protein product, partial [Medioppia subpectinata]